MFRLTVILNCCIFIVSASVLSENTDRVVNGNEASIQDFPHQCSLQKLERHACGCSIIKDNVVLTAAHCVDGATPSDINHWQIRAGTSHWESGGSTKKIDKIVVHPSYDQKSMSNDLALIKVRGKFSFGSSIAPIEIAKEQPDDHTPAIISGWGYKEESVREMSDTLQETTVNYLSGKSCSSSLYKYLKEITDGMICGEGETDNDACQGDSGGPLIHAITRDLLGVVSWGYGCAQKGYPGIYANTVYYGPWITKNAATI